MRTEPRLFMPFVIVIALAEGCATPEPIVRLEPRTAGQITWVSGRAVIEQEKDGVRVAAAFEHQNGGLLGVRLEIENDTPAPFDVSAGGVTYMSCPTLDNATCSGSWNVADPEEELDALDEQQSRTVAGAKNQAAFDTSMVLLSAVGDIGAIASGHANSSTGTRTAAIGAAADAHEASANQTLASIGDRRELWANAALRRNTLAPGRGISGLVFLPVDPRAQYLWIHVRAGGQVFPFGFRQTVRKLNGAVNGAPSLNRG